MLSYPIVGGLGNQLFILAAAFNMKSLVAGIKLVIRKNEGTAFRPTHWDSFFADCPEIQEVLTSELPQACWIRQGGIQSEVFVDQTATVEENHRVGVSTILEGYFQNWRYQPPRTRVLELFNIAEKQKNVSCLVGADITCAVHFRLGDYKALTHVHPILSDTYYRKALQTVLARNPNIKTILIFVEREDRMTVQTRLQTICEGITGCEVKFVSDLNLRDWEELIVMSLCAGIIIANSSFSWWAAYFSSQSTSTIVYPSQWKCQEEQTPENALALPGWIKVSQSGEVKL